MIHKRYNIDVCKSSIYTILKKNNISNKKINIKQIFSHKEIMKENIIQFKKRINKININYLITIDEFSVDNHIHSLKGWSKKGKEIIVIKNQKRQRFTVISSTNNRKVIYSKIIPGSCDRFQYLRFIKNLVKTIPQNQLRKYTFLMDNAKIHKSIIFKEYINDKKINIIYNVAYHPEFNPIEHVISKLKYLVRLKKNNSNPRSLIKNIKKSFKKITDKDIDNYYRKSLYFYYKDKNK